MSEAKNFPLSSVDPFKRDEHHFYFHVGHALQSFLVLLGTCAQAIIYQSLVHMFASGALLGSEHVFILISGRRSR